ncbi:MAG: glycoside hydrolase family 2 protein [Acidimicrobiia bacterium]
MELLPADGPRPAGAPVSAHSDFEPIAGAAPVPWSIGPAGAPPFGAGRLSIDLGGRWERAADESASTSFPEPDAGAAAGIPDTLVWRKVVVPDNFGSDDEFSAYFGPMWYRRRFADPWAGVDDQPGGRVRLRFRAVDYLADVWLNGEHLGHHEGAFAPFGFDVTNRLRRDNEVVVCVQDPLEPLDPNVYFFSHRKRVIKGTLKYHDSRPGGLPGRMAGPLVDGGDPWVWTPEWGESMTTAGITDTVELVRTGVVALDAMFVTPLDVGGRVQIAVVVTNHTERLLDAIVHLGIEGDAATATVALAGGTSRIDLQVDLPHLARWEPVNSSRGTPETHELHATLVAAGQVTDRRRVRFGLRTARVRTGPEGRPTHLEINGDPVFVKAVNYIPWQHFAEVGRTFYDRDMRMIAEAHGNSVGVHAHVQSPYAYDAADEAGILVFQDFPLQWFYDSGTETNPGFVDTACRQIAEMAYLLHHHPSVVYYTCHNEPHRQFEPTPEADDTPERDLGERHLDAALLRTLESIDASRHVHEASGIGDDVHEYQGSLNGGSMYRVGEQTAWFVSEYGFWTVGPQFAKFGDPPTWPPDERLLREWVSRLSFIGSTVSFAGLPARYPSLDRWADATETYGAALAKHQTEWFRAHRGEPFMGYRWHFWSDWWGYAGGGLVDVERVPKRTYAAFSDASRPLLLIGLAGRSVVEAGTTSVRVVAVNDRSERTEGQVEWTLHEARSSVIAPDPDGARIGLAMPPDADATVAIERSREAVIDGGTWALAVGAAATAEVGTVDVPLLPGEGRTLMLRWNDPITGTEENSLHLCCVAADVVLAPGRSDLP